MLYSIHDTQVKDTSAFDVGTLGHAFAVALAKTCIAAILFSVSLDLALFLQAQCEGARPCKTLRERLWW